MTKTSIELTPSKYNLFLGSMISYDVAPDVWNAKLEILNSVQKKLCGSSHCEFRWVGDQIKKFLIKVSVNNKKNDVAIFNSWKFEEFFEAMPAELIANELVKNIYTLPEEIFNINHAAIAYLAATQHCQMAVTSNFDNGIENACKDIGVPYRSFTWSEWKNSENISPDIFCILKLHGCAVKGDMVFTSEGLMSAKDSLRYESLTALLEQNQTIYCGYSGVGDVDIFQHLPAAYAIWTSLADCENENPFGKDAKFIDSNLKTTTVENIIVALANNKINPLHCNGKPRDKNWLAAKIEIWICDKAEIALVQFVQKLFAKSDRELLIQVHLALDEVAKNSRDLQAHFYTDYRDPPYLAKPYSQACKQYLKKIEGQINHKQYINVWTNFLDWRNGQHIKPLNIFCDVAFDIDTSLPLQIRTAAAEIALGILAEYALCYSQIKLLKLLSTLSEKYTSNGSILVALIEVFSNEAAAVDRSLSASTRLATINFVMAKSTLEQQRIIEELMSILKTQISLMKWSRANETCHRIIMLERDKRNTAEELLRQGLHKIKLTMNSDIFHKGNEIANVKMRFATTLKSYRLNWLYKCVEIYLPRIFSKYFDWRFMGFVKKTKKHFLLS